MCSTAKVLRGSRGNGRPEPSDAQPSGPDSVRPPRLLCLAQSEMPWRLPCQSTWYRVMPVSYHFNLHYLKVNRRKRFMLRGQQEPVGQEAGPAVQGALGRDPRQLWKIIAFRQMRQNHVGGLTVVAVLEEPRRGLVGQVSYARKHSLLHRPGVGAVAQHL